MLVVGLVGGEERKEGDVDWGIFYGKKVHC